MEMTIYVNRATLARRAAETCITKQAEPYLEQIFETVDSTAEKLGETQMLWDGYAYLHKPQVKDHIIRRLLDEGFRVEARCAQYDYRLGLYIVLEGEPNQLVISWEGNHDC